MRHSDLAEYLDNDPFLESPEPAPKATPQVEPMARHDQAPAPPDKPKRSAQTEQDKFISDLLRMVMEVFPGARWTTRQEYKRASANRDRKGRRRRG